MKNSIKVAHVNIETELIISNDFIQMLVIENADEFFSEVIELDSRFNGEDGRFVFSVQNEIVAPDKLGVMICDPFHFDLNDKKIVNLLYKRLEKEALGDKCKFFNDSTSNMVRLFEELAYTVPFQLSYEEPSPTAYFKAADLKFEKTYDTFEEKIICYINALIELKKCEFFVFVNLKSVLSDEKLLNIYKHCQNEKVGLLLVESSKLRSLLSCEKAIIITEDLCEILENYDEL